jgi:DNA segregation ATPase FtsK/SpoIIIE, S-DNA-T family
VADRIEYEPPVVFEGNAPADISKNQRLAQILASPSGLPAGQPQAWIGDPVAIKEPTAITFRRQSGANAIVIGQQEESAMAIIACSIISLAAQHAAGGAVFHVMDGTPADSPLAGVFAHLKNIIPQEMKLIEWRAVPEAMAGLQAEMDRRQAEEHQGAPSIYVVVYGLQRYRVLRRQEDSFSFGGDDDGGNKPQADKIFSDLLREGPALGMHVMTWADTPVSVERTFDRGMLREFDHRILFQMSANDSSNLIDSPMANKLGFYRALAYSEEQGVMEKFRPYALPSKAWLEQVRQRLGATPAVEPIA